MQFGGTAEPQALHQLSPDVTGRGLQSLHRELSFLVVAVDRNHDACGAAVRRKVYFGHRGESNAWIAQLALEDRADLLAQSLTQPFIVILSPTVFRHKYGL